MSFPRSTDKTILSLRNKPKTKSTYLQSEDFLKTKATYNNNIPLKKNTIKGNFKLKLQKNKMQSFQPVYSHKSFKKHSKIPTVPVPTALVPTCYPYLNDINYPITMNDWQRLQTPLYALTVPVVIPTSPAIIPAPMTPVFGTVIPPLLSPILPPTLPMQDEITNEYAIEYYYGQPDITNAIQESTNEEGYIIEEIDANANIEENTSIVEDPIESYLKLPKELFPKPNEIDIDPNNLIDEICKMPNVQRHIPWMLDLEFGVPKSSSTRPIPMYNVKLNSVYIKNDPDSIHPDFNTINPDLRRALMSYYDTVVSSWFKGYTEVYSDLSIENFQSFLVQPMESLGMCWP